MKKPIILKTLDALTPEVLASRPGELSTDRPPLRPDARPMANRSDNRRDSPQPPPAAREPGPAPAYRHWGINE